MPPLKLKKQLLDKAVFHNEAQKINADPMSRVPVSERSFLDPEMMMGKGKVFIDVHTHSFNIDYIPKNFSSILKIFRPGRLKEKISRWADVLKNKFLQFLSKNSIDIINKLADVYKSTVLNKDNQQHKKIYFVNLLMDMERGILGGSNKNYEAQLKEIIDLRQNKIPAGSRKEHDYEKMILPFIAIDPHNEKAFHQFLTVFAPGAVSFPETKDLKPLLSFVGVKLYPPLGYTPADPTLFEIFKVCESKNIPVLTHIGGYRTKAEHGKIEIQDWTYDDQTQQVSFSPQSKTIEVYRRNHEGKIVVNNLPSIFIQPDRWIPIFKAFPHLKICLAHMGDNQEWLDFRRLRKTMIDNNQFLSSNNIDRGPSGVDPSLRSNYVFQCLQLITKYPNVYVDISYSFVIKENIKIIAEFMMDPIWSKKILYGSDFYMTEVERNGTWTDSPTLRLYEELNKKSKSLWEKMTYENTVNFLFKRTV